MLSSYLGGGTKKSEIEVLGKGRTTFGQIQFERLKRKKTSFISFFFHTPEVGSICGELGFITGEFFSKGQHHLGNMSFHENYQKEGMGGVRCLLSEGLKVHSNIHNNINSIRDNSVVLEQLMKALYWNTVSWLIITRR